ncbi:MAG: YfhO family protein [Candidatus Eisenbacteria bacterium]|nr:YfhO family protein [Candidatus Eisenbacteria bacterium]
MTAKKRDRSTHRKHEPTPEPARGIFPGKRATLISVLIIVAIAVAFFWRVVFLGEILTGGDVLAAAAIFENYGESQMAAGHLPLWNPYIFAGMPFFDSMSWSAFIYPSYWIKFVLEKIPGVDLPRLFFLFLHYILAGLGTFFYLRSRKVGHAGAIVGGVAFMLSPHLVGLATIGHGGKVLASAYIPLVLMAAQRLMEGAGRRWIAILGLVGGLQFLARHVQVSYYTWLAVGLVVVYYAIARARSGEGGRALAAGAASVVSGVVLAALFAAVLLVPLQVYSEYSTRAAEGGGMGFENATMWSLHPKELLTLLVPSMFGLANETYWGTMPFQQVSHYVGYAVLMLAAVAAFARRGRGVVLLLLVAALGVLMAFGRHAGPMYHLFYNLLPGFKRFRVPAMSLILVQFSLAALAGYGASVLLREIESRRLRWGRWAAIAAGVGVVAGLIAMASRGALSGSATAALLGKHVGTDAAAMRQVAARAASMAFRDGWILVLVALATGGVIALAAAKRVHRLAVAAALLAIVVADVAIVDARFMHPEKMQPLSSYYPETPAVSFLKRQEGVFRIAPVGRAFSSNSFMYHGIQSIGGYHPAKLALIDDALNKVGMGNLKLLALLNVRYVVGPDELNHPAFRPVAPGVYENLVALPRVFLVGEAKTVPNENVMLAELSVDSFNPTEVATVMDAPSGPVVSAEGSSAELVSYGAQEITVSAEISQPCLLVFSEVYYPPCWRATVDGEEVPILRTDYLLRSVYLKPGEHTVVMRYEPSDLRLGLFVTLVAAAIIAALLAWPVSGHTRKRTA